MNQLQIFRKDNFKVRVVKHSDESWFVAKDVCEVLGLTNITETIKRLDKDDLSNTEVVDSIGRKQVTYIVNEPGLYCLILLSRKPVAKAFKRWITHEVIPQIRRIGFYATQSESVEDLIILQAQSVKELKIQVGRLEAEMEDFKNSVGQISQYFIPSKTIPCMAYRTKSRRKYKVSRLRRFRREQGFTLQTLSNETGISISFLSSIERGEHRPNPQNLTKMAKALDIAPSYLRNLIKKG